MTPAIECGLSELTTAQRKNAKPLVARALRDGWGNWIRGRVDLLAMLDGHWFDIDAAERVRLFFQKVLRLKDPAKPRAWVPFVLYDWQYFDCVGHIFGWKRPNGTRRFRKAQVWVPKKNGKTPLASGVMLYLMLADGEAEPEIYSAATTVQQAALVYKEAAKMVRKSPALQRVLELKDHRKRIECASLEAFYQVLSKDADGSDGINAHGVVFDELHRQKNRELYNTLQYAFAARTQPLMCIISTAGDNLESIGFEQFEVARKIIAGDIVDHEQFAYIAAAGDEDDWTDSATWHKANPSLGLTISEDEMRTACKRAQENPAEAANFKRLRLNLWVGRGSGYIDMPAWRRIKAAIIDSELAGQPCWGGLDLSSNTDLTAFVLKFNGDDGSRKFKAWAWLPGDSLAEREKRDGVPYRAWVEQGFLELTPGDWIDLDHVRRRICEISESYEIQEIAYDPAFASQISVQLASDGFEIFSFRQSAGMMTPVLSEADRLVRAGLLHHGNNPLLTWAASNLEVFTTVDGLMKPIKPRSVMRIDPIIALLMSLGSDCKQRDAGESFDEEYAEAVEGVAVPVRAGNYDEEYADLVGFMGKTNGRADEDFD